VRTDRGWVRGLTGWATQSFLGIPFAAPPVGDARWTAPGTVIAWSGVRDATKLAEPCATEGFGDGPRTTNEDCLYLNVYRPALAKPGAMLPVIVFFPGGGNFSGNTNIYDGVRMAEVAHAIVVIAAYRLGVFGSLALPSAGTSGGTFILQDNLAALRWVRRNIAAFGGNAHDVTASGQSSGGTDVCNLIASPAAAGLFRQAIVQSGLCNGGPLEAPQLATAQTAATAYATSLGCMGSDVAACLRAKPAGVLLDAWKATSGTAYGGPLLPRSSAAAFASGHFNKVPLLIGFTRDEWWSFEYGLYPLSADGLQKQFATNFGDGAVTVARLYPEANFSHREFALGAAVGDSLLICPAIKLASEISAFVPVSAYEFADRSAPAFKSLNPANLQPRPAGYVAGAGHTAELQYLYAYQSAEGPLDATQRALGDAMIARWVAFDRAMPSVWPAFSATHPVVVRIGADGSNWTNSTGVGADHHCDFWNAPK
jgi:para-nitrobenzyl esterase